MKKLYTILTFLIALSTTSTAQDHNYWNGSVDNKWSTAGNWSLGYTPTQDDTIHIENSGDSVHIDQNVTINEIIIENGAKLNFSTNLITIKGNFSNISGLVYGQEAEVVMSGTQAQEINGNQTFQDLTIDNATSVSLTGGQSVVTGLLQVNQGTLNANGNLTIQIDSLGNGSIGPLSGSINGTITVEKSFDIAFGDWRFLSSPVANATYNEINDDMWTSGFPGSTYPLNSFISVYTYDETVAGSGEYGYTYPTNISDSIAPGEGIMAYMGTSSYCGQIDFNGQVNSTVVDLPVTFTDNGSSDDGWNLVGNPMVSNIAWDHESITKTNMYDAIYIWNPEQGTYAAYVDGIGTNGGTHIISSCQSFWVKASGSNPVLKIPQEAKTVSTTAMLKSSTNSNYLKIKLNGQNSSDETVIKNNFNATTGFDGNYDALKFSTTGNIPIVYTSFESEDINYAINQFPESEIAILINTAVPLTGIYSFNFEGVSHFDNAACLILEDMFENQFYTITDSSSLDFTLSDTTTVARFKLHIGSPTYVQGNNVSCYGLMDGEINIAKNSDSLFSAVWTDAYGNFINQENDIYQITTIDNLLPGTYVVELSDYLCGATVDTIFIEQPSEITVDFEIDNDSIFMDESQEIVTLTNQSQNANYFEWQLYPGDTFSSTDLTIAVTDPGSYLVNLIAYQTSDCWEEIEKEFFVFETANISEDNLDFNLFSVKGILNLSDLKESSEIIVTNLNGQILHRQQNVPSQLKIDLTKIPTQMVIVNVIYQGVNYSKKVMLY